MLSIDVQESSSANDNSGIYIPMAVCGNQQDIVQILLHFLWTGFEDLRFGN